MLVSPVWNGDPGIRSFLKALEWVLLLSQGWKPLPRLGRILCLFFRVLPRTHASLNNIFPFALFLKFLLEWNCAAYILLRLVLALPCEMHPLCGAELECQSLQSTHLTVNGHLGRQLLPQCCCEPACTHLLVQLCKNGFINIQNLCIFI